MYCSDKEDVMGSCKNIPEWLSIFKREFSQYSNCFEAVTMKINFVSKALTKTLKLLQALVAVLVTGPCLFFISLVAFRSFIRKVNGIRFAPVSFVCNCFLSSIDETITQATRTKNSNVWKSASSPRSTNPDNFSSEYA